MASEDGVPEKCFAHPQASHFVNTFFFYAYGNTPPSDLLQHVPHDALRADILSLGCGDLRDLLYSIVLHGRRGVSFGTVPRQLTFTLNDWEPAIHARNLMLLQLILDARTLLEPRSAETGIQDGRKEKMGVIGSPPTSTPAETTRDDVIPKTQSTASSRTRNAEGSQEGPACSRGVLGGKEHNAAFAQRIGEIFSAMYNVFVDDDVLQKIEGVAGRLAASAASSAGWHSTELGRLVHFADDRSQDRVRDILALYADASMKNRVSAASVKKQRSAFIARRIPKGTTIMSRASGLASLRDNHSSVLAHNEMVKKYLAEGVLDPFPLLLADETAPRGRGPRKLVNPLLLVTERKGTAYCLHYAAFPLDAFHTEVASWKLRDERAQDEHGKLAPSVLKQKALDNRNSKMGPSTPSAKKGVQDAWLGAALEQLAQMCGGFLAATRTAPSEHGASMASATPHLRINIHAGDAIDLCDAMLDASTTTGVPEGGVGRGASSSRSLTFKGIAFQQGTLQPLRLHKDTFKGPRAEFDVISTSNLADHLGAVNLLVATAPLLSPQPHAVILTSFMASVETLHLHRDAEEFYKAQLCMSSQTAALLLGVVPVSSLSSVVGHADTSILAFSAGSTCSSALGLAETLRLTWKHPAQAPTSTDSSAGPTCILGDISPSEFASLTLPVYKAMFAHMPTTAILHGALARGEVTSKLFGNIVMPKHYTSVSFGRLLASAGRRLRLTAAHFQSSLQAIRDNSGLILASNLMQEQEALFHALGLAPMAPVCLGIPLDIRRVVLLVPASGLSLLRAFNVPEVFLAVCGTQGRFDNHFVSVHSAFVRARRGRRVRKEDGHHWFSLSQNLMVRDTREDDPDAELMVSAMVSTRALMMASPSLTELQLRPRDSVEMFSAPKDVIARLGGQLLKVFYGANLANEDRTAILTPGGHSQPSKSSSLPPPLVFPNRALSSRCQGAEWSDKPESASRQRFVHGKSLIDQSLELMTQPSRGREAPLMGRVKLTMANDEARENLAKGKIPHVEQSQGPCSVRVILGEELVHVARFPFPVRSKDVRVVYNKSKGYAHFTLLPLEGFLEVPFALTACNVEEDGWRTLLSTFCWPMCVPLVSLPRLDFNAEWAHREVMGKMSSHTSERPLQERDSSSTIGPHLGFRGMKASILTIAASACTTHNEDNPVWKQAWVCITNNQRLDAPALWVWVNEILLDSSNQALVLDCCIMPVDRTDQEASLQLGAVVGGMATNFIQACHEEFELWTALLPVAVERARQTYEHASDCIYSIPSDAIPSSAHPAMCGCGMGKDLPPAFMGSMKSVKAMAGGAAVSTLVYRAAISPLYAPPETAAANASKTKATPPSPKAGGVRCAKCSKGGSSLRCSRCRKVRYCSSECQRQDWKNHKAKCVA